jgi:hypothetical protein
MIDLENADGVWSVARSVYKEETKGDCKYWSTIEMKMGQHASDPANCLVGHGTKSVDQMPITLRPS